MNGQQILGFLFVIGAFIGVIYGLVTAFQAKSHYQDYKEGFLSDTATIGIAGAIGAIGLVICFFIFRSL